MNNDYDEKLDAAVLENQAAYESHEHHTENYLSPLWTFARIVRSLPPFGELSADETIGLLDEWLLRKGYGNPDDGWEEKFAAVVDERGDACQMFIDAFEQIRFGYGETLLSKILQRTVSGELLRLLLELPSGVLRGKKYRKFIA